MRIMPKFKNPSNLNYEGNYYVELIPETDVSRLPAVLSVQEDYPTGIITLHIRGKVQQAMGGIQMYSHDSPFHYGYKYIRCIRDEKGKLLWVNNNFNEEILK